MDRGTSSLSSFSMYNCDIGILSFMAALAVCVHSSTASLSNVLRLE